MERKRHKTHKVFVGNIPIGGDSPIVIQSMTNTDTSDIESTFSQIIELADSGSEIVRITVNDEDAAKAVPFIKEKLLEKGYNTPLVGCFHYNGHTLLNKFPGCATSLDKYRINPGNIGFGEKHDRNFEMVIKSALKYDKPIRIGVNWGSLDPVISSRLMDENKKLENPLPASEVTKKALIESAITSAEFAGKLGMKENKIILSCKVSRSLDLIDVYRELAKKTNYALHLGLTEAGMGIKGIASTSSALSVLLLEGIGDTIRASLTPRPGESRNLEVITCREILQSLNLRAFAPQITACPGCGRTTNIFFQELAVEIENYIAENMPRWRSSPKYKGIENLKIAVMGCIVNGPGESKHANIGISLPGNNEEPAAPVFIDGYKTETLRGNDILDKFKQIVNNYIEYKYKLT